MTFFFTWCHRFVANFEKIATFRRGGGLCILEYSFFYFCCWIHPTNIRSCFFDGNPYHRVNILEKKEYFPTSHFISLMLLKIKFWIDMQRSQKSYISKHICPNMFHQVSSIVEMCGYCFLLFTRRKKAIPAHGVLIFSDEKACRFAVESPNFLTFVKFRRLISCNTKEYDNGK